MLALTSAQIWVLAVAGTLVGFAVGSFACVIIERLPVLLDEPNEWGDDYDTRPWGEVLGGESRCSSCGASIRWIHKIPVISWIALRGKCRGCGDRIPGFHPLVELAVPVVGVALTVAIGWEWRSAPAIWLVPIGIIVSVIDLRTYIVPTRIVWPSFLVAVALSVAGAGIEGEWGWLWGGALGVALIAGPLVVLWFLLPNGMGFGDVRLATLLGWTIGFTIYTGSWTSVGFFAAAMLFCSSIVGIVLGIGGMMTQGRKAKVPFGPALFIAAVTLIAFHAQIIDGFQLA